MKKRFILLLAVCLPLLGYSQFSKPVTQEITPVSEMDKLSIGVGLGLDYGGIGANLTYYPGRNLGLFGGLGYNFATFGWNVGAKVRFVRAEHRSKIAAYLLAMYGTNASINLSDGPYKGTKSFYGPTIGVGIDFKSRIVNKDYWSIALNVPFRSQDFNDLYDEVKRYGYSVSFLSPITISFGYRFTLK